MVGQKNMVLASFRITITDTAQLDRTSRSRLATGELDGLIAGQSFICQDRPATDHTELRIGLKTRDKQYSFLCQLVIPGVVGIAPVDGHHAAFGEFQCTADFNVTGLAFRDGDELREIALMIQADMELDRTLGRTKISPRKSRQAQVDGRGIQ